MSKMSFLLVVNRLSFLASEDNFPRDNGRIEEIYYTFFNEFFLIIKELLFYLLLVKSVYAVTAKDYRN